MISAKKRRFNNIITGLLLKAAINNPPVNVTTVANLLQLKIKTSPYQGKSEISGVLIREANKNIIGVNANHNIHRQRFTVAHEIAHFLLHEGSSLFVDKTYKVNFRDDRSKMGTNYTEIEANTFASMLLMPDDFLAKDLMKYNFDLSEDSKAIETIANKLADKYNVSSASMLFRLINR